ncbi:MAG: adenosylmethionine decarboxylase [Lachnospiraceae bacterium]|nr:adenosylmethionine decarboxylase [Lachnospiraceae bacterium]
MWEIISDFIAKYKLFWYNYELIDKCEEEGGEVAQQLFVDLYQCDEAIIDDMDAVKEIAHKILADMQVGIVEECFHKFEPIGITYIAVITTSHFSIHTWPEYQYAAVDIFSCNEELPVKLAEEIRVAFGAKSQKTRVFERNIKGGENSEL